MRRCLIAVLATVALGTTAERASAEEFTPIGKHGVGAVFNACQNAGGEFKMASDGAYGCRKENCDGKGGECIVACSPNQDCYGSTPGSATPPPGRYDLVKILKFSPARVGPPGPGLLQPTPEGSPHGPSGMGTPKPTAPAPVLR